MQLEQVKARAEAVNKVALEEEKERDAAEKAVEELKRQLQPKRTRTDDDAGDAHDLFAEFDNCDLSDHRREGMRVQNRRNVQVRSRDNQKKPRTDKDGFLHHTRLGLVGWISYWCCGDTALAVVILVVLINTLGLTELVSDALGSRKQKDVSVCKCIMSCFSFLFLGVVRHYAKWPFTCWYKGCSRVRGRGLGSQSSGPDLLVAGCTCTKQTVWAEDHFTVTSSTGIGEIIDAQAATTDRRATLYMDDEMHMFGKDVIKNNGGVLNIKKIYFFLFLPKAVFECLNTYTFLHSPTRVQW